MYMSKEIKNSFMCPLICRWHILVGNNLEVLEEHKEVGFHFEMKDIGDKRYVLEDYIIRIAQTNTCICFKRIRFIRSLSDS